MGAGFFVFDFVVDPAEGDRGVGAGFQEAIFWGFFGWGVENILMGDEVEFVEDVNLGLVGEAEVAEDVFDDLDFFVDFGVGDVDDMEEQVRFDGFGEGGFEGLD